MTLLSPFSDIDTLAPFVLETLEFMLSAKFLLKAFYIGTIELNNGIKSPSPNAIKVANQDGIGVTCIPGWFLNKYL